MKYLPRCFAVLFAFGLIALSAGPAPAVTTPAWGHGHGHGGGQNLSGQYSGSVTDSTLGTGTAVANLVGAGVGLGGYFGFTFASTTYTNPTLAGGFGWNAMQPKQTQPSWGSGGGNVYGVFESTIASAACEFSYSASYSPSDYTLTGSYQAVNGCSGESGTFTLTQSCYYSGKQYGLRRDSGLSSC